MFARSLALSAALAASAFAQEGVEDVSMTSYGSFDYYGPAFIEVTRCYLTTSSA